MGTPNLSVAAVNCCSAVVTEVIVRLVVLELCVTDLALFNALVKSGNVDKNMACSIVKNSAPVVPLIERNILVLKIVHGEDRSCEYGTWAALSAAQIQVIYGTRTR